MNLVNAIANLPKNRQFDYVNERNAGKIVIDSITLPEGPIRIKRFNPVKGKSLDKSETVSISRQMLWRLANAIREDAPINLDRVLGASYNTRSVIESLLAHTPQFYWCKLDRLEVINTRQTIRKGHKHLIYLPNSPHENGILSEYQSNMVISEMNTEVVYQSIDLDTIRPVEGMSIEETRRHAQIQIALVKIGHYLGYRTWVAANDRGLIYNGQAIAQMDGVIDSLSNEKVLSSYSDAINGAKMIDCIWFRNGRLMPAVLEIEHSTGIKSGLTRMKNFCDYAPRLQDIRWTIVAPDEYREKVIEFANMPQFRELDTKFFPYSAVEELYSLCERRKPQGITDQFLDSFMENCITH
ncbi:restriction endonuclease [Leclercia sp. LSNIH1]|nr:restriction endonuclease [Leclercia sp. LSNIH1]POV32115.1 restriction endonuclease [Leclercia sp. LSNIH5]POW61471.1 restriction endonuclease [Leclercia sp. LSNIH2]